MEAQQSKDATNEDTPSDETPKEDTPSDETPKEDTPSESTTKVNPSTESSQAQEPEREMTEKEKKHAAILQSVSNLPPEERKEQLLEQFNGLLNKRRDQWLKHYEREAVQDTVRSGRLTGMECAEKELPPELKEFPSFPIEEIWDEVGMPGFDPKLPKTLVIKKPADPYERREKLMNVLGFDPECPEIEKLLFENVYNKDGSLKTKNDPYITITKDPVTGLVITRNEPAESPHFKLEPKGETIWEGDWNTVIMAVHGDHLWQNATLIGRDVLLRLIKGEDGAYHFFGVGRKRFEPWFSGAPLTLMLNWRMEKVDFWMPTDNGNVNRGDLVFHNSEKTIRLHIQDDESRFKLYKAVVEDFLKGKVEFKPEFADIQDKISENYRRDRSEPRLFERIVPQYLGPKTMSEWENRTAE